MLIFPAIDLYDKKAVRLYKGDYNQMTVYSENPLEVAKGFKAAGAEYIHMVDLEGAKDATTPNFDVVAAVAGESGLKVEIGGGIRNEETVKKYIDAGVMRVILGTAALNDRAFLERVCGKYGDKIRLDRFMTFSCILAITAYLGVALLPIPALSLICCALCGLSVGIMWPGTFSSAAVVLKRGGTAMFALLALSGDLGCSLGPSLVGFVSGLSNDNLKMGILVAIIFPVLLLFGVRLCRKNKINRF